MVRINCAEASFVIRDMSEGASGIKKKKQQPKQTHKNRCKSNEDTSPALVCSHFVCDILSCVSLG